MNISIVSLLIILFSSFWSFSEVNAYDPGGKSPYTTNPSDPKYYDNNVSTNKLISSDPAVQAWAQANPTKASEIITANGGQCGNNCFNAMKSASASPSAAGGGPTPSGDDTPANTAAPSNGPKYVIVTEKIPGANCDCIADDNANDSGQGGNLPVPASYTCGNPETRKYKCEVKSGLEGFQVIFAQIVRWFVYITMLLGVIAIIGAGVLWAFGSESEEYTKKAKGWVINIFIGLFLLFTFRYILGFLAPWVFR